VPKQRVGVRRIVLIRAQTPRNKTISCICQATVDGGWGVRERGGGGWSQMKFY